MILTDREKAKALRAASREVHRGMKRGGPYTRKKGGPYSRKTKHKKQY